MAITSSPKPQPNILTIKNNVQAASQRPISFSPQGAVNAAWFVNNVRPGGKWDYKTEDPAYESFGNMNFSAVGAAQGWSLRDLHGGAGAVQRMQQNGDRIQHFFNPKHGIRESEGEVFGPPPGGDQRKDYNDIEATYGLNW